MIDYASSYQNQVQRVLAALPLDRITQAIEWLAEARAADRQVFVCGNGGSAMTASHFVCDMVKGCSYNRPQRFRITSLNESVSTLTAYSNDVAYESVFVEQLKNFARPGDVLLALSGSGNSPNVLRAVEYANQAGLKTIGFTGRDGGRLGPLAQLQIHVAEPHMGRIEDAHMVACHIIAYYFMDTEQDCHG